MGWKSQKRIFDGNKMEKNVSNHVSLISFILYFTAHVRTVSPYLVLILCKGDYYRDRSSLPEKINENNW